MLTGVISGPAAVARGLQQQAVTQGVGDVQVQAHKQRAVVVGPAGKFSQCKTISQCRRSWTAVAWRAAGVAKYQAPRGAPTPITQQLTTASEAQPEVPPVLKATATLT